MDRREFIMYDCVKGLVLHNMVQECSNHPNHTSTLKKGFSCKPLLLTSLTFTTT